MGASIQGPRPTPLPGARRPASASRAAPIAGPSRNRGGFVLAFVVFMLFSISVAGAAGYLIVQSEFGMAKHSSDGAEALAVARAGLERFVAEHIGAMVDTVSYALGDGVAVVTTRRLFSADSVTDHYYVRSEATVADLFAPDTPARRVVAAYAVHRRRPLAHHAVAMIAANTVNVGSGGVVDAADRDDALDCPGGGVGSITGVIARTTVTEGSASDIQGSPQWELWGGGYAAMADSVSLRWDVLSDPAFPVEFENTLPNYGAIPADSFPVVRYTGWVTASFSGRGLLIIDGTFDPTTSFNWDGIVLAGVVDDVIQGHLDGLLVGGLDGPNPYATIDYRMITHYHSCMVYAANETLSYLELVDNTIFEVN